MEFVVLPDGRGGDLYYLVKGQAKSVFLASMIQTVDAKAKILEAAPYPS